MHLILRRKVGYANRVLGLHFRFNQVSFGVWLSRCKGLRGAVSWEESGLVCGFSS